MQLTRWLRSTLPVLVALPLSVPVVAAEVDEQDGAYAFRNFGDSEDIHVKSHFGRYNLKLASGTDFYFQFNHERVTVPGVQAVAGTQEAVDAITTASRPISGGLDAFQDFTKVRNEFQGSVGTARMNVGYYVSKESDYFAQQVSGGYNRNFFEENLNLSFGSSFGWDAIDPLEDEDTAGDKDTKTTLNTNLVATQILSPTVVLQVGGEISLVRGLQHNPYRNVYAGGGPVPERHPDDRTRSDVFLKVSKYLKNRSSIRGSYVAYRDSWGVTAHTLGARLSQYVSDDVFVRYRYRFYTQGAAEFYRTEYTDPAGIDGYRTADYRLEEFNAHLFGAEVNFNLGMIQVRKEFLRRLNLKIKYERYFNSNNFSANIFESGLVYEF